MGLLKITGVLAGFLIYNDNPGLFYSTVRVIKVKIVCMLTSLLLLASCTIERDKYIVKPGDSKTGANCGVWDVRSIPIDWLKNKVSIEELDKSHKGINPCAIERWELTKKLLKENDEIWHFHKVMSEGGYVIVRDGIPWRAVTTYVH